MGGTGAGMGNFYRRPLPSPPAIPFASHEGKLVFKEAMEQGGMEGYFRTYPSPRPPWFCSTHSPPRPTLALPQNASRKRVCWRRKWGGVGRISQDGYVRASPHSLPSTLLLLHPHTARTYVSPSPGGAKLRHLLCAPVPH